VRGAPWRAVVGGAGSGSGSGRRGPLGLSGGCAGRRGAADLALAAAVAVLVNLLLLTGASRLTREQTLRLDITAPQPVRLIRWSPPPPVETPPPEQAPPPAETAPETPPPVGAVPAVPLPSLDIPLGLPPSAAALPVVTAPPLDGTVFTGTDLDEPPAVLARIPPEYPLWAREQGIEGSVRVRFLVTSEGRAERITIVEADPPGVFDRAVLRILPTWTFTPGRIAGRAVPSWMETTVRFELRQ